MFALRLTRKKFDFVVVEKFLFSRSVLTFISQMDKI